MLMAGLAGADQTVRVLTWNLETVGAKGSGEYNAALDVLQRIGADVVAMQEIFCPPFAPRNLTNQNAGKKRRIPSPQLASLPITEAS
jgi:exonuclease III